MWTWHVPFPAVRDGVAAPINAVSPVPEVSSRFHLQDVVLLTPLWYSVAFPSHPGCCGHHL